MIDWDDLRFVLAVARTGSALRAARMLNVNQTTVTRRIAHIESTIGADLFESRQSGQSLTALGQIVAAGAERVEAEVLALKSAIDADRRMVSGAVRFTSSEVYANRVIAPFLRSFRRQFPGVTVELIAEDRRLDVARGEADVALRASSRPEGGGIVAQRLPDAGWAGYCSRSYADEHGVCTAIEEIGGHSIVLVEGPMARLPAFQWVTQVGRGAVVGTRSNSLTNLLSAVKAGLGIGMLPCFVGDAEDDLVRCLPPMPELDAEVWLIVREDIRQATHVRAFVDSLSAYLAARRHQLSGRRPAGVAGQSLAGVLALLFALDPFAPAGLIASFA
jgi:DNA-binding transcriptional LysR family regulator